MFWTEAWYCGDNSKFFFLGINLDALNSVFKQKSVKFILDNLDLNNSWYAYTSESDLSVFISKSDI